MDWLKWLWQPAHYWVVWFVGLLAFFALREFWALGHGRPQDTFSWWVWDQLDVDPGEGLSDWTAAEFLVFGCYCTLFLWLAGHFFWRKWAG